MDPTAEWRKLEDKSIECTQSRHREKRYWRKINRAWRNCGMTTKGLWNAGRKKTKPWRNNGWKRPDLLKDINLQIKVKWSEVKSLSHVRLFATPRTVAHQAPQSMEFSRQEYWSGLPFPSPGDLPNPGIEPVLPALQTDSLTHAPPGKPYLSGIWSKAIQVENAMLVLQKFKIKVM